MIGATALTAGCVQRDTSTPTTTTDQGGSNRSDPDPEPKPEPEPDDEPTLRVDRDSREVCKNVGNEWRTCEALDEWEVLSGSLEPATDRVYAGSQSARLRSDGDGATVVRIPIDSLDLSNTTFSLSMYVETPGDHYTPDFDVAAPDIGHTLGFRTRYKIDEPGWLRHDLGLNHLSDLESEEPSLTIAWYGEDVDWYIDDIRTSPVAENPRVVIQFDDSLRSTYETAYPIMQEYDIQATTFTVTDRIDSAGSYSLTLSQMNEMKDASWEFGSHTASHPRLAQLSRKEQRAELEDSKRWLLDHGFEQGAGVFAYPFGSFTPETVDIVSEYYHLGTHEQRGAGNRTISAPLSMNRHPGDYKYRTLKLIDFLMDERLPTDTLVLCYHGITEDVEDKRDQINPTDFRETMQYIDNNDVRTMLTSDLWEYQAAHNA